MALRAVRPGESQGGGVDMGQVVGLLSNDGGLDGDLLGVGSLLPRFTHAEYRISHLEIRDAFADGADHAGKIATQGESPRTPPLLPDQRAVWGEQLHLSSLSVDELLTLRDNVAKALSQRAGDLHRQLAALGSDTGTRARGRDRRSAMKGKRVPAKYRSPEGDTWAGRGAMPRWMAAAIKEGKKKEDFLIERTAATTKRVATKRGRPAKKRRAKK